MRSHILPHTFGNSMFDLLNVCQECQRLQQQVACLEDEHKGNVAELVTDVEAIKKAMADQQDDFEKAAQRAKQQQEEELSLLKARLVTVTGGEPDTTMASLVSPVM